MRYQSSIEELFKEVSLELKREGISVSHTKVKEVISSFFSILVKLIRSAEQFREDTFIKRISLSILGNIIYNPSRMLRISNRNIVRRELTNLEICDSIRKLYSYGWRMFKWTLRDGYIFVNDITGEVEILLSQKAKDRREAYYVFARKKEKDYNDEPVVFVKELKLIPVNIRIIKGILKYDLDGNFIMRYDTMQDVLENHYIIGNDLFQCLYSNERVEGFKKTLEGFVWFLDDGNRGKRRINCKRQEVVYNFEVDILDPETNTVLYERIGTPQETAKFLRYIGVKHKVTSSSIVSAIKTKYVLYGYKFRAAKYSRTD